MKKNESGDSENSGNTGNSGNSGGSGDSGNSGNTGHPTYTYNVNYSNYENYIEEIKTSSIIDGARTGKKIFDNSVDSENGCWHSHLGTTNQWLEIKTVKDCQITKFTMQNKEAYNGGVLAIKEFELQTSSDGTTWTGIAEFENESNESEASGNYTVDYDYQDNYYKYYRIFVKTGYENYSAIGEMTFEIKTTEEIDEVMYVNYSNYNKYVKEIKTSSNVDASRTGEKIFDDSLHSESGCWHSTGGTSQWLALEFKSNCQIKGFTIQNRSFYNTIQSIKDFSLQASSDGINWSTLQEYTNHDGSSEAKETFSVDYDYRDKYYKYYRIRSSSGYDSYISIGEMTFQIKITEAGTAGEEEEEVIEDSAVIYKFGEKTFNEDDFETYNLTPSLNDSNQLIFSSPYGSNGWITYKKKVDFNKVKKIKVTGKRLTGNNTYLHFYLGASGSITQGKDSSFATNYPVINNEFSYEVNITKTNFLGYATIEYCLGDIQIDSWELIKE